MWLLRAVSAGILGLVAALAAAQDGAFFEGTHPYSLAPRFALVIGVPSVHDSAVFSKLQNPINDAEEITKALRNLGFTVLAPHENFEPHQITRQLIKRTLYNFTRLLKDTRGAVGLVYFSGHGVELYTHNYLVAYDGYVRYDRDLYEELIPLTWFYDAFKYAGNKFNMLIIDACRTFTWPELQVFGTSFKPSLKQPSSPRVVKAYATLPGDVALDGFERNSPYAEAFLEALKQPDIALSAFFQAISRHMKKKLKDVQVPEPPGVGSYDFIFHPTARSFNREFETFHYAQLSKTRSLLEEMIDKNAHGYFSIMAEDMLQATVAQVQPEKYVELRVQAPLRERPQDFSAVMRNGAAGAQFGVHRELDGKFANWVPVYGPGDEPLWVEEKLTVPLNLASVSHPMSFQSGTKGGTETLTQDAQNAIKAALQTAAAVKRIKILGRAYKPPQSPDPLAVQRLLARQAAVLRALEEAGYRAANVTTSVDPVDDPKQHNAVEVVVTTATR